MSSKENYIQGIRTARTQQLKWLNQIKLMVSGVSMEKDAIPVNQTDSAFSQWLYNDAMVFSTSNAKTIIDEMGDLHTRCYDIYLRIYGTLFGAQKGGLMGMFTHKKAGASDLMLAQNYYAELVTASDQLVNRLRAFESLMLATPESKFDELIIAPSPAPQMAAAEAAASDSGAKQKIYFRGRLIEG
jgi:hypothetical protein